MLLSIKIVLTKIKIVTNSKKYLGVDEINDE